MYFVSHTKSKRRHSRAHSQVNNSIGGILSGFSPGRSAPIPPTLHHRSETQLRNPRKRSRSLYSSKEKTLSLTREWQPQSRRRSLSISRADHNSQIPYQGMKEQVSWPTSQTRRQTPGAWAPQTWNLQKGEHKHSKLGKKIKERWQRKYVADEGAR